MTVLFFDTETSGKWHFQLGPDNPKQPHLLQIAVIVDDDSRRTVASFNFLVKWSSGINIDLGAMNVHKITVDMTENFGIPPISACTMFDNMMGKVKRVVCHNTEFDINIIRSAAHRIDYDWKFADNFRNTFCTMKMNTDYLKIPGPYGYKWPTLDEAYRMLVDPEGFEGAHDAMIDVQACRKVYYATVDR